MLYFRRNDFQALREGGTPATKSIAVKANPPAPYAFRIREARMDDAGSPFKLRVVPVETGREYRIDVLVDRISDLRDPGKSLKGRITVITDDPDQPEVVIRCVAFF
jgi:hypothetical protein